MGNVGGRPTGGEGGTSLVDKGGTGTSLGSKAGAGLGEVRLSKAAAGLQ